MRRPPSTISRIAILAAGSLLTISARGELVTLTAPVEIPNALVQTADDFRPKTDGFLLLQTKPIVAPPDAGTQRTYVEFRNVATDYTTEKAGEVNVDVQQTGSFPGDYERTIKNYWVRNNGTFKYSNRYFGTLGDFQNVPNGTATFDLDFINGYELNGSYAFVSTAAQGAGSHSDDYHGVVIRDETGSLALLREDDHGLQSGAPPAVHDHTVLWRSDALIKTYPGATLPAQFGAGMSGTNFGYPVVVYNSGTQFKLLTFTPTTITESAIAGASTNAGMVVRACAENAGEVIVVYTLNSELRVFSNTFRGDRLLGAIPCDANTPVYAWFDDIGAGHISVADIANQIGSCGAHYYRGTALGANWTSFVTSASDATEADIWFDLGELTRLKTAATTETNGIPSVYYFQFENGAWNTSIVATGTAGQHFDHVSTGSIADGSKIIIYRMTTDGSPNTPQWFVSKGRPAGDVIPELLGEAAYRIINDSNEDGLVDAADVEQTAGK